MRVMTYNIGNGAGERRDAVLRVIADQRPDVLSLQELRGFDGRDDRFARFAAELGMRGFLARSWLGQPVAVLVGGDYRVLAAAPVRRPFHHAAMRVTVASDRGPLVVLGAHLWPYGGGRRRLEAGWLAGQVRSALRAGSMAVALGDLNSLDPGTDHADRIRRLPVSYRSRHVTRGRVDTRAVARLTDAGLVDLYQRRVRGRQCTVPTEFGGAEFAPMRLDYILATPAAAHGASDWRVVDGGGARMASDHFPVVVDLALHPT